MLIRTALAVTLLLPSAAAAQALDTAASAVVRIFGTREGNPVRGSGFVVALDPGKATVVTASHVIEGVQQLEVTFAADLTETYSGGTVFGMGDDLAVFQVRGSLPAGVTTLSFEVTDRPRLGEALSLLGFPQMEPGTRMTQRTLSGRRGTLLLIDQGIGEGFSGGPVLQGGKVVGVVTSMDDQTTYAVSAVVALEALEGWGIKVGGKSNAPAATPSPITAAEKNKLKQVTQSLQGRGSVKELKAALQLAREVADAHPDWREAQTLAAEAAYRISRWHDAAAYFRRGGDPGLDQPERIFYMAVALYETGDTTAAAAALERCLPNLQRSPYVDAYARKILGNSPIEIETCRPREEITTAGIILMRICPGTFMMGSAVNDAQAYEDEKPAHKVTLSEFWIGKTEITNAQYRSFRPDHQGEASLPATGVSWDDAKAACEHFGGRLPTEAEWEYAARAGSQTTWSFGDDKKLLAEYAWFDTSSGNTPHPVGTKKPNSWQILDMHGNVWEWVADWYGTYSFTAQSDPVGPTTGTARVLRGGAFNDPPSALRSAFRFRAVKLGEFSLFGFRCVRVSGHQLSVLSPSLFSFHR